MSVFKYRTPWMNTDLIIGIHQHVIALSSVFSGDNQQQRLDILSGSSVGLSHPHCEFDHRC